MTTVIPLPTPFIIMWLISCIFYGLFCLGERLQCVFVFACKIMFQNFSKNVFNSLLLPLDLFFPREFAVFSYGIF